MFTCIRQLLERCSLLPQWLTIASWGITVLWQDGPPLPNDPFNRSFKLDTKHDSNLHLECLKHAGKLLVHVLSSDLLLCSYSVATWCTDGAAVHSWLPSWGGFTARGGNASGRAVDCGLCLAVGRGWISLHTLMAFTVTQSHGQPDITRPAVTAPPSPRPRSWREG